MVKLFNDNPNIKQIEEIVTILQKGGVIIYPTDTVYGIGCDITNSKAIENVAKIKGANPKKKNFSFICYDLSHLSNYTKHIDSNIYKLIKKNLPGPFTFILNASNNVPKVLKSKKKTVGIRIPDNNIIREIVRILGNPILTTSLHDDDEITEYTTDPEEINNKYKNIVDVIIDGGYGKNEASTIVDCTNNEIEILRQGVGELYF